MRGTTPTLTLRLPFEVSMVAKAKVAFKLDKTVLLTKHTADIEKKENTLTVRLTREETLNFPDDAQLKVQWEIETPAGDVLKTVVYRVYTGELLDEGELM